ncbi:uncharacterized protein B0H18DRAFT_1119550 [Fomitopsis serialis]|uniref:uncharacterized protein n=1 Tax=Fomitopsis serialis TaxID=139415 RepID=UPI0020072D65|nr:uncharacterized protein B0H18DRAFT_1119550 [Neoantrodia serialis]KAH9925102.1 hypothetical protein B0H18DRAFT_1119550 [Neoantrodia serialis]
MLKIGERAYPVDPSRDPRRQRGCSKIAAPLDVGQDDDPLAQQMVALKQEDAAHGGRRDATANKLSPPPDGSSRSGRRNSVDYRRSAEIVAGAALPASDWRSTSPNPYPKHMLPPSNSFPGERKSISRLGSRPGSVIGLPGQVRAPAREHQRPTSHNSVGIVLDPTGRVALDEMANR